MSVRWEWRDDVWESIQALHESNPLEETKSTALVKMGWTFGLMHYVGFGSITDKNKDEFYTRLAALQGICSDDAALCQYWDGENTVPLTFTREDIHKRVGLCTNYEDMTHARWIRERFNKMFDAIKQPDKK